MASFRIIKTDKSNKIQVAVRKFTHRLSRVFTNMKDAKAWAKRVEIAIETSSKDRPFVKSDWLTKKKGAINPKALADVPQVSWSLDRALEHYGKTISVLKKGWPQEIRRIAQWRKLPLSKRAMSEVTTADIQSHVDKRVSAKLSASTVRKEVMLLRALYRDAKKVWKLGLPNPCNALELPRSAQHHRERRLEDGHHDDALNEEQRLREAFARYNRGDELLDLMDLAIETGLRRSELLYLRVKHICTSNDLAHIELEDSKSGRPRRVFLSLKAQQIVLKRLTDKEPGARLFSISDSALARFWIQARKEAGITGLRWNDLRHEALSRMASKGLHIEDLQAQAGYTTPTMLLRYFPVCYQDIADKLR